MKNIGTTQLKTERLTLRRLREDDILILHQFGCLVGSVDEVKKRGQHMMEEYQPPFCFHWVIEFDGAPIGRIRAWDIDPFNNRCQLGYDIAKTHQNQGFMTEAVKRVIDFLFNDVNIHRIFCHVREGNIASMRICEKCGMTFEGTLIGHYKSQNGFDDVKVYGIVKC